MPCFKTIILKTHSPENKVKVHMFEVPVFVASLTGPLFIFVFDYDQKKRKQQLTVTINKKHWSYVKIKLI